MIGGAYACKNCENQDGVVLMECVQSRSDDRGTYEMIYECPVCHATIVEHM